MSKKSALGVTGNKAYARKVGTGNFEKYPWCIYFYYLSLDASGTAIAFHYFHADIAAEILPHAAKQEAKKLVRNARLPIEHQSPPPDGANGDFLVWRRRSYIIIAIDVPDVTPFTNDAIRFDESMSPNHSFFDAWEEIVPVDGKNCVVIGCINHMKADEAGHDLTTKSEKVKFEPNVDKPFEITRGGREFRWPDDGGTNMGPPIPP